MSDNKDILVHYGVLGMKWGIRRDRATLKKLANKETTGKKSSVELTEKEKRKQTKKNRRNLSDKDLKAAIDRLKQENEFKKLSDKDLAPVRSKIQEVLAKTAGEAGITVGRNIATAAFTVMARKILAGENVSKADLAAYLKPKKK